MKVIIVSPSLDFSHNVSGVSAVTNFIIKNNEKCEYVHFLQGKSDEEKGGIHRLTRIISNYKRWKLTLNEYPDAIIHYNFPLDAMSIIRDFFFMRKGIRKKRSMVIHLHGGLFLFKEKKPWILRCLLKKIFSWDVPFITLSGKEKERLLTDYKVKNVQVLPNCVDLSAAKHYTRVLEQQKMDILYLGRIEPNKGIDYIYKAAQVLKEKNFDFILHFAGKEQKGCNYIERFRSLLGQRFVYEGVVFGEGKNQLLRQCNVFLLPSFYEGLPISLLECMSFGMAPVTTDVGSISDFVKEGETGLFVKVKDVDSIVDALIRLAEDNQLRIKISQQAKEMIIKKLAPHSYIGKLNAIYGD